MERCWTQPGKELLILIITYDRQPCRTTLYLSMLAPTVNMPLSLCGYILNISDPGSRTQA